MKQTHMPGVLVMIIVAAGILSPTAMAGRASVATACSPGSDGMGSESCDSTLTYVAAPGEENNVAIDVPFFPGDPTMLRDVAAAVVAGTGCAQLDAHSVRCPKVSAADVQLGDRDDRAAGSGDVSISGGAGNDHLTDTESGTLPGDRLSGGAGDDVLIGGNGDDTLGGGAGRDTLTGRAGDDALDGDGTEHAASTDTIDGGPGADTVGYVARHQRLTVDLAAGRASGSPAESDALSGIENVRGGFGPNLLRGDAGPNRLVAGSRGSVIEGRGGDDELIGSRQRDRLSGGEGDDELSGLGNGDVLSGGAGSDTLYPQTAARPLTGIGIDRLDCGSGSDVTVPYRSVLVPRNCESVTLPGYALVRGRLRANRRIAVRVERIRPEEGYACTGSFALRGPDRRVRGHRRPGALLGTGHARFPRGEGATRTASIRLTARGRAAARRSGPLNAVLELRTSTRCGNPTRRTSRGKRYAYRVAL